MTSSVILVDMGNTSVSFALARDGHISRRSCLATHGLCRSAVSGALSRLVRGRKIGGSILCSVVPAMNGLWLKELRAVAGSAPMLLHHRMNLGIDIALPEPGKVGADRLANACAVSHLYGVPAIVVDFGTALTFDVVSKANAYVGGVIAPGLSVMTDYFAERTALLPRLDWKRHRSFGRPSTRRCSGPAIGKNTVEAMLIGARIGYLGMVREIIGRLRKDLKSRNVRLCATGGYAGWVLSGSDLQMRVDPDLTLRGISRIYELNETGQL